MHEVLRKGRHCTSLLVHRNSVVLSTLLNHEAFAHLDTPVVTMRGR